MTGEQLSIFDALDGGEYTISCPYCGWSWTDATSLSRHIEGSNGWPFAASETGQCENQRIYLYRIGAQQHFGLRLRDDDPNQSYRNDLLGVILDAKQRGCTDRQIKTILTTARKRNT